MILMICNICKWKHQFFVLFCFSHKVKTLSQCKIMLDADRVRISVNDAVPNDLTDSKISVLTTSFNLKIYK